MTFKWAPIENGRAYRFKTDYGDVCVVVHHKDPHTLAIYELHAALSAVGKTDAEFKASWQAQAARNRFGVKAIREILRVIQKEYPDVHRWGWDPVVRRHNPGPKLVEA